MSFRKNLPNGGAAVTLAEVQNMVSDSIRRQIPVATAIPPAIAPPAAAPGSLDSAVKWFAFVGPFLTLMSGFIALNITTARLDERS
jgi:hypothetical protein